MPEVKDKKTIIAGADAAVIVTTRMNRKFVERLQAEAEASGLTASEIIRASVDRYLKAAERNRKK